MVYKLGGYVFASLKATESEDGPEIQLTEKERKKMAKLERQQKQQEVRHGHRS
jgi:hypothetical protein